VGEVTNVGRYCSGVSFDLAVWEGARPATDEAAATEFQRLYGRWIEPLPVSPPTPAIRAYVDALLAHWPDIDTDAGGASPWADAPLLDDASGPIIFFAMVWGMADEAGAFASGLARDQGLVCFDPQSERLI
jgi:hypothetical protein